MKHIGVLIDFSEVCLTSIAFTKTIARRSKAKISLIHALDENEGTRSIIEAKFKPYVKDISGSNIECSIDVAFGDYETEIPRMLVKSDIELLIIGTHGVHGFKQVLFGSNILRLVQKLKIPTLIVQEKSVIPQNKETKILLPISPHKNFMEAVLQTAELSKVFNSKVLISTIIKSVKTQRKLLETNKKIACNEFDKLGISFELSDEPATYSLNYGKLISEYAQNHNVDFISIMSQVSSIPTIMGNDESEKIILNETFLPVLCVNK